MVFSFYLKEMALDKISRISYSEYLKIGSGSLLQKLRLGQAGRNIHLNFYGRLFRELIPETFLICFYSDNRFKISSSHFNRLHFYLYCNQVFVENIKSYKENSLISEEIMNNTLIRGITEMVTFRINKRYKKK